jgi:hypothetical protein
VLTYCNITALFKCTVTFWHCYITPLFKISATCWHFATLPRCSKAQWHADILQLYRVIQMHGDILTMQHYRVLQKLVDMVTYCNITTLFKSSVTYWHITTFPRFTEVRCHADILQYYPFIQKLGDILTHHKIILLFEGNLRGIVTRLTSRDTIASRDKGFSLVRDVQTDIGTHAVFCSVGTGGCLEVKQADLEHSHSSPCVILLACLHGTRGNNFTFCLIPMSRWYTDTLQSLPYYSHIMLKHCHVTQVWQLRL